jgi:carbon monoxide dehydrogenase subunit G
MKIARTIEYAAPPAEVFAVLADPAFQDAKCAATAAISHSANVETKGDQTIITTERVLPSDDLPDFARSMIGDTLKVLETQTWSGAGSDGSRTGTVEMSVPGAPITLKGKLSLKPSSAGTVETLDADLKAGVPLIGGKIEKAAAPPIEEAITIETQTAKEWLGR